MLQRIIRLFNDNGSSVEFLYFIIRIVENFHKFAEVVVEAYIKLCY